MSGSMTPSAMQNPVMRILRNARTLLSGKAAGGVLSLAYLAIAARSLGPEAMGVLVLAHAYIEVIAGLVRFQSWQAVIKFGSPMLRDENAGGLKRLLRYTIRLDIASAAASIAIALALAPVAAQWFGWPDDARGLVIAYCLSTPFLIAATPTGVLRLFDQFKPLGWQMTVMPLTRFIGALALWAFGGGLGAFLVVWIASVVMHGAALWVLGYREMRRRNVTPRLTGPAEAAADRAWLPFMIKTNLSSSIDLMYNNLPVLIVGGVLGGAAASFFKLAFNLANLLGQPINMFNQAVFPELTRIEASDGRGAMVRVTLRTIATALAVAAPFVCIYVFFRAPLAVAAGGEAFRAAAPLVALMAGAQLIRIIALGLESAVLALGRAGWILTGQVSGGLVHLGVLYGALASAGVIVAPIGIAAGWAAICVVLIAALLKR